MITMKFGGTSVGSVEAIQNLVEIVGDTQADHSPEVVVVVSAMAGVTDMLQAGIASAESGDPAGHHTIGTALREKHRASLKALAPDEFEEVIAEIEDLIDQYVRICDSVAVLGEATPRAYDFTMGLGERMSVHQVSAALRAGGIASQAVSATSLIVTDDGWRDAVPYMDLTRHNVQALLKPLIESGHVPVVTGFIGATQTGIPTTLGRGGSDYSAAIIGACLDSDEVWIWTDVPGVMSADPRIVDDAHTIESLTYREVGELAYYGAKVLHPKTIRPVQESGIPIRVKSTFDPAHPGTVIVQENGDDSHPIKAVTEIKDVALLTVEGKGMLGVPGIAARTFGAVAETGTSVLLITQSSSEQSICFMIPEKSTDEVVASLNRELGREIERRDIDEIQTERDVTIITVVGAGMLTTPGVAADIFRAVADVGVNVVAIAHGSSHSSISFAVREGDGVRAVRAIHALTGAGMG